MIGAPFFLLKVPFLLFRSSSDVRCHMRVQITDDKKQTNTIAFKTLYY